MLKVEPLLEDEIFHAQICEIIGEIQRSFGSPLRVKDMR